MNILLIGSGGREHAIAWKVAQSSLCSSLFIAPGNAGTQQVGTNVALDVSNHKDVIDFCENNEIEMVIIGPEAPLVNGLADDLNESIEGIKIVGPNKAGAQLEGSKAFSKDFMKEFNIPTAKYQAFTINELQEAFTFLETLEAPYVLKADGLAAGKGVLIIDDLDEAKKELEAMLQGKFGNASTTVVIEEFLDGPEFSVFVLTDGTDYKILPVARDYKRVGEGNTGPNTGGMGAVSPVPFADRKMMDLVKEQIIEPTINGLQSRDIYYCGFIFLGLINVNNKPKVIEYNCRLGDPETEVILPRITSNFLQHLDSLFSGTLSSEIISIDSRAASTLVLASGGYPGSYEKGKTITGLDNVDQSIPFLAGVKQNNNELQTNGGRVLMLTSFGLTYAEAAETSRRSAKHVDFEGCFHRSDIGKD